MAEKVNPGEVSGSVESGGAADSSSVAASCSMNRGVSISGRVGADSACPLSSEFASDSTCGASGAASKPGGRESKASVSVGMRRFNSPPSSAQVRTAVRVAATRSDWASENGGGSGSSSQASSSSSEGKAPTPNLSKGSIQG